MLSKIFRIGTLLSLVFFSLKIQSQSLELQNLNGTTDFLLSQDNFNIPRASVVDVHQQNNKSVFVWIEQDTDIPSNKDVYCRIFEGNMIPLTDAFVVNTQRFGDQINPFVKIDQVNNLL